MTADLSSSMLRCTMGFLTIKAIPSLSWLSADLPKTCQRWPFSAIEGKYVKWCSVTRF